MAVFRVERTRDYTVMCNHHLKDSNLSLKAKGLLSMMLSLPDEWNYTTRGLAAICKEGVDAIGKTLKELELAGYIIRRQLRGKDGRISDTEYTIFEKPRKPSPPDTTLPDTENPYLDNPDTEAPDTDNPAQLNTKKSNTQKSNTDLSSTHSFFLPAADGMTDGFEKKAEIREQIEYDILCQQYDWMQLDELVEIIYVTGSLNVFNHHTNVDVNSRIVCYDIKELGKQLKKIGMLVVQDQVWNRVTINRAAHKTTRYYLDEFHLLLKEEQTASYSVEIWKRYRKWGGIPTGITQNVKDLLSSREVENIFENSDFIYMLNQAAGDRQILAKQLNISPHQLSYVTHSGEGEGLLFYGNTILPFIDHFPKDTELYRVMTTKPQEVASA